MTFRKQTQDRFRAVFEEWVIASFSSSVAENLKQFDPVNGYKDPTINGMWLGFWGYAILRGDL